MWTKNTMWTEKVEQDLIGLHAQPALSFKQIAQIINDKHGTSFSRNATIGKAQRMGLKRCETPAQCASQKRFHQKTVKRKPPAGKKINKKKLARPPKIQEKPPEIIEEPKVKKEPLIIPDQQPVSFMDLGKGHCRYIISEEGQEVKFCGAQVKSGSPFCPAHHEICFQKPKYGG